VTPVLLALAIQFVPPEHPFQWIDPSVCATRSAEGFAPRDALVVALMKQYPLMVSPAAMRGQAENISAQISVATCPDGPCPPGNPAARRALRSAAEDMFRIRANRRYRLVWLSDAPEPEDTTARVAALFDLGRSDGYHLQCLGPPPPPPPEPPLPGHIPWTVAVGATLAEIDKPLAQREAATVSFRADDQADTEVGTIRGAVLASLANWTNDAGTLRGSLGPYLAYERMTASDPAKEVNNVEVGLRGSWLLYPGAVDPYEASPTTITLATSWLTDDQGDSSAWRAELGIRPGLDGALFRSGYGFQRNLFDGPDQFLVWSWDLRLVTDYAEVLDPGAKQALLTRPSYLRWGYDLSGELRLRRRTSDPAFALSLNYQFRDDWNDDGGNADRITGRLKYYPADDSNWAFGLEYDRGENLQSLEAMENWLITIGYRR
jgi:hypothetical protein